MLFIYSLRYDENLNLASMLGDDGVSIKYIRTRTGGQKILHGDQVKKQTKGKKYDLFNNILFMVIWHRTYGKGEMKPATVTWAILPN